MDYENGDYLQRNPTWHTEDSAWKATYILDITSCNNIQPKKWVVVLAVYRLNCSSVMEYVEDLLGYIKKEKFSACIFFRKILLKMMVVV